MIEKLNAIAGKHGVGRVDLVENRRVGMKTRGLYETPGGTTIVEGLRALEELVLDRETLHYREHLGLTFAELVYDGRWFTPLREALWACGLEDRRAHLRRGRRAALQGHRHGRAAQEPATRSTRRKMVDLRGRRDLQTRRTPAGSSSLY